MTAPNRGVLQLILAVLAAAGCAWSWVGAQSVVEVAPVIDGEPATTSVVYDPPLLTLALLLAAVAGVLVVLAVANLRRRRRQPSAHIPHRGIVGPVTLHPNCDRSAARAA